MDYLNWIVEVLKSSTNTPCRPEIGSRGIIVDKGNVDGVYLVWWPLSTPTLGKFLQHYNKNCGTNFASYTDLKSDAIKCIREKETPNIGDKVYLISNQGNGISDFLLESEFEVVVNLNNDTYKISDGNNIYTVKYWQIVTASDYRIVSDKNIPYSNKIKSKQKIDLTDLSTSSDLGLDESLFKLR